MYGSSFRSAYLQISNAGSFWRSAGVGIIFQHYYFKCHLAGFVSALLLITYFITAKCVLMSGSMRCISLGLPAFWGSHGWRPYPAALPTRGVPRCSDHPQHHLPLHQLYQVQRTTIHHTLQWCSSMLRLQFRNCALPLRALDSIAERGSTEVASFVEDVLQTLNDLIEYFKQPDSELEHEQKQCLLRSLIKRQDLFKEEVRVELELFWSTVNLCFFFYVQCNMIK